MIKEEVLRDHLAWSPQELPLIKKVEPDFDVTWAKKIRSFNTDISVYFIKPKNHISQAFGFEQELLLAVSGYQSPEARLVQAVEQTIQQLPAKGRVDQTAVIVVSAASNIEKWLDDYSGQNPQTRAYIGIYQEDLLSTSDSWFVRNKLSNQLFSRDLFDYTLPLDSDLFFFGRQAIVAEQSMRSVGQKIAVYSGFVRREKHRFYSRSCDSALKMDLSQSIMIVSCRRSTGGAVTSFLNEFAWSLKMSSI